MSETSIPQADVLYQEILRRICLLDYPPGTPLSENSLAIEFNVSRSWLRSLLQRFEFEGLLIRQSGSSVVVNSDDLKMIRDAFYLRIRLYGLIAEDSPRIQLPPTLSMAFDEILSRFEEVKNNFNVREYVILHMDFHEHFMQLVDNSLLQIFVNRLYYRTIRAWVPVLPELWNEEMTLAAQELQQSIDALRVGNMALAALARRDILTGYVSHLLDYLGQATPTDLGFDGQRRF